MVFGRVITAMVTPFDANLEVDYEKTRKLARYLVDNGSDGLVVAGTTGEASTLSSEEKIRLFETVASEVGDRAKIIAGTGNNDTADSIFLTQAAQKAGVHGIMAVVPYYNKPPQEGIYKHFRMIAEATDLPVMLYNIPGRTVVNAKPETIARLAEIKNIVALKEASGSLEQTTEIKRIVPEDFAVYCGEDSLTLPMLSVGCSGVISVVSHVAGNEIQDMIKAYKDGEVRKAQDIHYSLYPLFKGMFVTTNPIPVKAALNLMGLEVGGLRAPMIDAGPSEVEFIKQLLIDYNKL